MKRSIQSKMKTNQSGFTLLELLVSMVLGMVVIGGVMAIYIPSLKSFKQNSALSTIQESERYAFTLLATAIQQAGYKGCDSRSSKSNLIVVDTTSEKVDSSLSSWALSGQAIGGFKANDTKGLESTFGKTISNVRINDGKTPIGDIFYVVFAGKGNFMVSNHDPVEQTISFFGDNKDELERQSLLQINDCSQATLLRFDSDEDKVLYDSNSDTTTLNYASVDTDNCTAIASDGNGGTIDTDQVYLGGGSTAGCADETARANLRQYTFKPNTTASTIFVMAFFLGRKEPQNQDSEPTLYSMSVMTTSTGRLVPAPPQPLLEGVENMRILYGIDGNGDNIPDGNFVTAAGINDWSNVKTVKISLLMRSSAGKGEADTKQNFFFPDVDGTRVSCESSTKKNASACPEFIYKDFKNQSRMRHVVEKVYSLRNSTL